MKIRTVAATTAAAAALSLAPVASADAIDDTLAKLPQGPISCEQAERYWTNEADYNTKVRQAQTIARFDSRGPQILAALARVDEAATRCGLKGGGNAPAQNRTQQPANQQPANRNQQPAQPARPAQPAQPAQPAKPAQTAPVINLVPPGMPSVAVPVAGVATLQLPDILKMIIDALAGILDYFNVKVPGINA